MSADINEDESVRKAASLRRSIVLWIAVGVFVLAGIPAANIQGCSKDSSNPALIPPPTTEPPPPAPTLEVVLTATPSSFEEGTIDQVTITATRVGGGTFESQGYRQARGPRLPGSEKNATFVVDVRALDVAADTELVFELPVSADGLTATASVSVAVLVGDMTSALGEHVQIGGQTTTLTRTTYAGEEWVLYNVANRLSATPVTVPTGPVRSMHVQEAIHDIALVTSGATQYALLATGQGGIVVTDVTDPASMEELFSVNVNYYREDVFFAEGGGAIVSATFSGVMPPISALATDGTTLWIADEAYGIHRTSLDNLLGAGGPVLEPDGTLKVDHEAFTLQFAGEHGWGGPTSLRLHGGRLFATLGYLGLGIYDPVTLEQVGRYNLYTDISVHEDWFVDMDVATRVQSDAGDLFLDPVTGMPDHRQASFEILQVWHGGVTAPTPWADFDRYGKFYYHAYGLDVAEHGAQTIVYLAYGLGGLVAVDVTGFDTALPGAPLTATYLGGAPAVPARGPDEPSSQDSQSLFPYFGAGKLKEGGVNSVAVRDGRAYYSDHFAGLVVLDGAATPQTSWRGPNAPYDNDDPTLGDGVLGDHWPDDEFVTSYDMDPFDPADHESLPKWMFESPCLLATGEVSGHGNRLMLLPGAVVSTLGGVDVIQAAGAGGLNFMDLADAPEALDRFSLVAQFPTTDEVGAAPDGTPTAGISIGHTDGVSVSGQYLYVADGPHGLSAWRIADAAGTPIDDVHLVANTVQDEYAVTVGGTTIYPATHAVGAVFDPQGQQVLTLCQSVGLRRVNVSGVEAGQGTPGAPLLLRPQLTDFFEHNGASGSVKSIKGQDHAYDVVLEGTLAFVADGSNGLTVYDLSRDPTVLDSGFVVGNLGGESGKPALGRAVGLELWHDGASGRRYAIVAAGQRGIGVVDATNPASMTYVKVFEPIKIEVEADGSIHVGMADGRCTDVSIIGSKVYFTYDSFGVLCYSLADLLAPLPGGIDPLELWGPHLAYDYRPEALARFALGKTPGYEELDGGGLGLAHTLVAGRLTLFVAYGGAGLVRLDWTNTAAPKLLELAPTAGGECNEVVVHNGRVYVADHDGGLVIFR